MKTTHKILLINALIIGSFLLGIGGASAQMIAPQACNTPSGRCTAAAPWCNSGYNGMLVPAGDTSGSCQTTNPNYTMRSTQKPRRCTAPLILNTLNNECELNTPRPLDCTGLLNSLPNGSCREGYYCGTTGGANIGCVPNGQYNYGSRGNITNITPPTCDPSDCYCVNGVPFIPPTQQQPQRILPPVIPRPTANVFEALWNFITHKRTR